MTTLIENPQTNPVNHAIQMLILEHNLDQTEVADRIGYSVSMVRSWLADENASRWRPAKQRALDLLRASLADRLEVIQLRLRNGQCDPVLAVPSHRAEEVLTALREAIACDASKDAQRAAIHQALARYGVVWRPTNLQGWVDSADSFWLPLLPSRSGSGPGTTKGESSEASES